MKFVVLLFVFCCYFTQLIFGDVNSTEKRINLQNQTHFMDLNADCKLLILEKLDLSELISVSELNNHLSLLVENVLRCRLAGKLVVLPGPYTMFSSRSDELPPENSVIIEEFPLASKVLKNYGHLISSIKIDNFYMPLNSAKTIYKLINLHCSETLTELHISNTLTNIFDAFEKPFKIVENLLLEGSFDKLDNSNYGFNELFPSMRFLKCGVMSTYNTKWINNRFEHLEYVHAHLNDQASVYAGRFRAYELEQLIRSNPQIKNLTLKYVNPKLLKFIADQLPRIENLQLENYDEFNDNGVESYCFHFEHMKSFSMRSSSHSMPVNISFGNLLSMHVNSCPVICSRWIEFVERSRSLKKFSRISITKAEILRISSANLNFNEISFECDEDIQPNDIVGLIEGVKDLKKIILKIRSGWILNEMVDVLGKIFYEEWNINVFGLSVCLQRINLFTKEFNDVNKY